MESLRPCGAIQSLLKPTGYLLRDWHTVSPRRKTLAPLSEIRAVWNSHRNAQHGSASDVTQANAGFIAP